MLLALSYLQRIHIVLQHYDILCHHAQRLTPALTGRRPDVAVRFKQIRKRAAVTCNALVRRLMSATLLRLAVDNSEFSATDDKPKDTKMELSCYLGLLKVLPPPSQFVSRQDSSRLRFGQVPVEEAMRKHVI